MYRPILYCRIMLDAYCVAVRCIGRLQFVLQERSLLTIDSGHSQSITFLFLVFHEHCQDYYSDALPQFIARLCPLVVTGEKCAQYCQRTERCPIFGCASLAQKQRVGNKDVVGSQCLGKTPKAYLLAHTVQCMYILRYEAMTSSAIAEANLQQPIRAARLSFSELPPAMRYSRSASCW